MFSVGQVVTKAALVKEYDQHFWEVLGDLIQNLPRKKRERQKYKINKELPSKAVYMALKVKKYTSSVENLIDEAYQVIEELASEMREAYDNMPESLQQGDVGERRNEAADQLENISPNKPDWPSDAPSVDVVFFPHLDTSSRSKRASEAADMLTTAAAELRAYEPEEGDTELKEQFEQLADQLEEDASDLESVDFPGMYS